MQTTCFKDRQGGATAIMVAISLAVLVGALGIAVDTGRLFINKSELQSAADACALAAASELVCDPSIGTCPVSYLINAENAGRFAAARNRVNFQSASVALAVTDIKFSTTLGPNSNYLTRAGGASLNSRYAMCSAQRTGIVPWFMTALGMRSSAVSAQAVATLAPSQSFCNAAPVGICQITSTGPNYGYTVGQWIASTFTSSANDDDLAGGFKWIDYTPSAGGNCEIRDQLVGNGGVCGITVGSNVAQPGQQQGAKHAWNTRFGIYPNGASATHTSATCSPHTYNLTSSPPDRTGYAYPSKTPGPGGAALISIGTSAYSDYRTRQNAFTPFSNGPGNQGQYDVSGPGGNVNGNPSTVAQHQASGAERRLVAVPIISCGTGSTPIVAMACALMLNPMSNGANGTVYLEYRGRADASGSPCQTGGVAGGPSNTGVGTTPQGPQVPTLVQ